MFHKIKSRGRVIASCFFDNCNVTLHKLDEEAILLLDLTSCFFHIWCFFPEPFLPWLVNGLFNAFLACYGEKDLEVSVVAKKTVNLPSKGKPVKLSPEYSDGKKKAVKYLLAKNAFPLLGKSVWLLDLSWTCIEK